MLVSIGNKCATYLSIASGREDDVGYIRYGLQIIFRGLSKFILLSAVAGIIFIAKSEISSAPFVLHYQPKRPIIKKFDKR